MAVCFKRVFGQRIPADGEAAPSNLQHMALECYGHVDEIASLVAYLAGPEASLITSASLLADGGYSA
jgi:3-oxoacyl-[acyl-carrier protein] reductase